MTRISRHWRGAVQLCSHPLDRKLSAGRDARVAQGRVPALQDAIVRFKRAGAQLHRGPVAIEPGHRHMPNCRSFRESARTRWCTQWRLTRRATGGAGTGPLPAHRHGTPVSRRVVPATTRGPCGHTHHRSFRGFSGLLLVGRHLFFCGGQRGIDFVDRRGCPASWRRQRPFLRLHGFGHSGSCARCRAGPRRERRCFGWARRSIAAAAVVWNPGHSLVS
jgi:hypothetical protein